MGGVGNFGLAFFPHSFRAFSESFLIESRANQPGATIEPFDDSPHEIAARMMA